MHPPDFLGSFQASGLSTSETQPDIVKPSLVTRLQKMHGLTKKQIYGSQPHHQPFISEERVCNKCPKIPTPLSLPPLLPPLSGIPKSPNSHSPVPYKTKADRVRRLSGNGPLTTDPPDTGGSSGCRSPWYCWNSQIIMPIDSGSGSYASLPHLSVKCTGLSP
jgi:hypothetical protein